MKNDKNSVDVTLTYWGIEANLNKCRAILEMKSPTPMKEVQCLTGKIVSLSIFMLASNRKLSPSSRYLEKKAPLNGHRSMRLHFKISRSTFLPFQFCINRSPVYHFTYTCWLMMSPLLVHWSGKTGEHSTQFTL